MRRVTLVLISLILLSIVPGTAIAQESVWTDMAPETSPPARQAHAMAYDAESDRIVLFGGATRFESGPKDDTWAYDFNTNTWSDMNPGVRPSPRWAHAMAHDAESDRVILFGGTPGPETWAYDYNENAWTNMSLVVQPDAWLYADVAYDANADRIILFGGWSGSRYVNETWAYDFDSDTWILMDSGTQPSPRAGPRLVYDTESDHMVLFGGGIGTFPFLVGNDETWAHQLAPTPLPIPPWVYIAIGVVAAAVVAVVAVYLTRRRRRMRKGEEGE